MFPLPQWYFGLDYEIDSYSWVKKHLVGLINPHGLSIAELFIVKEHTEAITEPMIDSHALMECLL